jgi:UDP-hydrolysing UDP-N-acetyl-D-glucosamine 2-epimerase
VTVCGAPGLDNIRTVEPLTPDQIQAEIQFDVTRPFLMVTFHPVTLEFEKTAFYVRELLRALDEIRLPAVFTYPNVDTSNRTIIDMLRHFARERPAVRLLPSLGTRLYLALMSRAAALVGNSSSGLIEAASFRTPVVNIGTRQCGRVRAHNVIDVGCSSREIGCAIRRALSGDFRATLSGLKNPYDQGGAAERIVKVLQTVELGPALVCKRFTDLGIAASAAVAGPGSS